MTDENEPQWRIVVEVPERLSFEDRDRLTTAVQLAVERWQPADRDWDYHMAATPVEHWELDDERLRREGEARGREDELTRLGGHSFLGFGKDELTRYLAERMAAVRALRGEHLDG